MKKHCCKNCILSDLAVDDMTQDKRVRRRCIVNEMFVQDNLCCESWDNPVIKKDELDSEIEKIKKNITELNSKYGTKYFLTDKSVLFFPTKPTNV